ncbi:MAG: 16S rRNA (guanine(527)-N(7))-methyltransferase RsmG [Oscillospiraceae bacterium]|nr:16S rRNA (guanine(527)-N(7))-methyltransferase RsmG [Oscillospiraceae bacterium]
MGVENSEIASIISRGAESLNIKLPPGACAAFGVYYSLLEQRGQGFNLTAIKGAEDVARLHFLDSLALLGAASFDGARVIDIGSGAGFPGVPLKIAVPSVSLALLDATGKRVAFLSELCAALGIEATCHQARAEEAAHRPDMRERYDVVFSRAVARLDVLCELCLPFVCVGGVFLAMKGIDATEEIDGSRSAIKTLGAEFEGNKAYTIPETDITRGIIVIRKTTETPLMYPRRYAKILNTPL